MINIEITKGSSENNLSALRRFTKRVQGSGVLPRVRSKRYTLRTPSKNSLRAKTVSYLKKKETIAELVKMGKIPEGGRGNRRRR